MTRLLPLFALSLVAVAGGCGEEEPLPPEIVDWIVDPVEIEAGGMATRTVELLHFELTGEHGDTTGMTGMTGMSGTDMGTDAEETHDHADGEVQTGHVHIYLDDTETNPLLMQVTESDSFMIPAETALGEHTLIARLHGADHLIIKPEVTFEVDITVLEGTGTMTMR